MKHAVDHIDVLVRLCKDMERAWKTSRPQQRRATEAELAYWMKMIDDIFINAGLRSKREKPSPPPGPPIVVLREGEIRRKP